MLTLLNEIEVRVLGALVEKQVTTPEYYPLTLNALVQACNQKNNRFPVAAYDERTVARALDALRDKNLVYVFYGSTSRVPKYKHLMRDVYEVDEREAAILVVLMLRGEQTVGELRERAGRLSEFAGLGEVEDVLSNLAGKDAPLVARLPRQPGHKEARYAHLLSGEVIAAHADDESSDADAASRRISNTSTLMRATDADRVEQLEAKVETLSAELESLRREFEEFKNQFG